MFVQFLVSAISVGITFLYGCVGEIITEKSGHLNLGIPGIMCAGAAGGCWGVSIYMASLAKPSNASMPVLLFVAILFAVLFAGILGALYCFLTVTLRSNQNVTGLAITTFGIGFTNYFIKGKLFIESIKDKGDELLNKKLFVMMIFFVFLCW